MHYNMRNLIEQYDKEDKGKSDLVASDIQQLYDIAQRTNIMQEIIWDAIINSWKAGYSAGYNKAKREAQKKGQQK